ncbi:pentapeptide repeat-containing protein [Bradyrhizobium japonicum]
MSQRIGADSECTVNEGAEHYSDPKDKLSSDGEFVRYWSRAADRLLAVAAVRRRTEEAIRRTGIGLQLSSENLSGHDLSDFPLRRCTLNRAQLYGTKLDRADLSEANLICPGLSGQVSWGPSSILPICMRWQRRSATSMMPVCAM